MSVTQELHELDDNVWLNSCSGNVDGTIEQFDEVTNLLLERPNLNSTHLFRADILLDDLGCLGQVLDEHNDTKPLRSPAFNDFTLKRVVVRRLIPRKPQLDKALDQSCFVYEGKSDDRVTQQKLVVYMPHCISPSDTPWYHPPVKGLAYLYSASTSTDTRVVSIHHLPYHIDSEEHLRSNQSDRLTRTFLSLLSTISRLMKSSKTNVSTSNLDRPVCTNTTPTLENIATLSLTPSSVRDTILPQHLAQDTYSTLKQKYASHLISLWVEATPPEKHVFEDLSIAAFLIELWKSMYGSPSTFPGFIDVACGNGLLSYILVREGWHGWGFDARRRKTWAVVEEEADQNGVELELEETVCIPQIFLDAMGNDTRKQLEDNGVFVHSGDFKEGSFIVSNHADELTCWTPVLAKLSCLKKPLPFLAIPCCSRGLDGGKRRYTLKDVSVVTAAGEKDGGVDNGTGSDRADKVVETGDLRALRKEKDNAKANLDDKSMYGCLTRKTAALAMELGSEVEMTLLRIPSTRNIGIVGNRLAHTVKRDQGSNEDRSLNSHSISEDSAFVQKMVERECSHSGGLQTSARTWIDKARKLQTGQGRGKVNWKGKARIGTHELQDVLVEEQR